jgi:hypothetical protein
LHERSSLTAALTGGFSLLITGADLNEDCFEDGEIVDWDGFFQCDLEGFDSDRLLKDIVSDAESLFDVGWRAKDKDQLIDEYNLTDEDAEDLCDALQDIKDR